MPFRYLGSILLFAGAMALTSCQHKAVHSDPPPISAPTVSETAAPPVAIRAQTPFVAPRSSPKKVALVLGPGGAKAWAHVGVLKALQRERIPVTKVMGLEWGALVGALFSQKGQVNDVEWKLYKMEQRNLPRPTGLFTGKGPARVGVMDEYLAETFGRVDVAETSLSFSCPARNLQTGMVIWSTRGLLKDVIRRCLAYPPVFAVEMGAVAAPSLALEAIQKLKVEGYDPIILVDVLASADPVGQDALPDHVTHVILWQEIKRAIDQAKLANVEVITVETGRFPMGSFGASKELRQLGDDTGRAAARKLVERYGF